MAILQRWANNLTNSESFKSKKKITGKTHVDGKTKDVEMIVPLNCLSNFEELLKCH